MRVEFRDGAVCVVAETHDDNNRLQQIGADPDRALVSVNVVRDAEVQPEGECSFEPLVIVLSKVEDDLDDMFGNTT